jgi:hypothetical protein
MKRVIVVVDWLPENIEREINDFSRVFPVACRVVHVIAKIATA